MAVVGARHEPHRRLAAARRSAASRRRLRRDAQPVAADATATEQAAAVGPPPRARVGVAAYRASERRESRLEQRAFGGDERRRLRRRLPQVEREQLACVLSKERGEGGAVVADAALAEQAEREEIGQHVARRPARPRRCSQSQRHRSGRIAHRSVGRGRRRAAHDVLAAAALAVAVVVGEVDGQVGRLEVRADVRRPRVVDELRAILRVRLPLVTHFVRVNVAAGVHLQAVRELVDRRPLALGGARRKREEAVVQLAFWVARAAKVRDALDVRALARPPRLRVRLRATVDVELARRRERRPADRRVRPHEKLRGRRVAQHSVRRLEPGEQRRRRARDSLPLGAVRLEAHRKVLRRDGEVWTASGHPLRRLPLRPRVAHPSAG